MLVLRVVFLAVTSVTLLLGVCESGVDSTDQAKAQRLAMKYAGDDPNTLPTLDQVYDCVINIGHQPAAPASPFHAVQGKCVWSVKAQGSSWLVTFHETWFCSEWSATGGNYPPCDSVTGNHEWEYLVSVSTGTAEVLSDRGQFAPDM